MSSPSLPSEEDADKAFNKLLPTDSSDDNDQQCHRDIIMDILNYATNFQPSQSPSQSPSSTSSSSEEKGSSQSLSIQAMIQKSIEASTFLINALNRFYSKCKNNDDNDGDNDDVDTSMEDVNNDETNLEKYKDVIEDTIIDIIWLVGLLLEPTKPYQQPSTANNTNKTTSATSNKQQTLLVYPIISSIQYKSLCTFIENLHNQDYLPTDKLAKRLEPSLLSSLNNVIMKTNKPVAAVGSDVKNVNSAILKRSNQDVFFKKLRKINTDGYYRQKRYNLLPEESEGYAKLFNFLNGGLLMEGNHSSTGNSNGGTVMEKENGMVITLEEKMDNVKMQITEYIGTFDLDPNRCLDITLDSLEYQIQSMITSSTNSATSSNSNGSKNPSSSSSISMFDLVRHSPEYAYCTSLLLGIISMFPIDNVTHMIGFKYSSYKSNMKQNKENDDNNNNENKENTQGVVGDANQKESKIESSTTTGSTEKVPVNDHMTAPKSLHYTTAILASRAYVSLPTLIPHLSTSISSIIDQYKLWKDGYMTQIRKTGIVSLNSSNNNNSSNTSKSSTQDERRGSSGISESWGYDNDLTNSFCEANQFIQLLNVMVEIGLPWDIVCGLFQTKSQQRVVEDEISAICSIYKPLQLNLCSYISRLISPLEKVKVNQIGMNLVSTTTRNGDKVLSRQSSSVKYIFGKYSLLSATQTHNHGLSDSIGLLEFCDSISKPLAPIIASGAIASHPILYCKICRLIRVLIDEEIAKVVGKDRNGSLDHSSLLNVMQEGSVFTTLKSFIVPSLSLFPYNPAISAELWNVLSVLPYQIRYAMYALWRENGLEKVALRSIKKNELFSHKPLKQIESEVMTSIETKYILKRMSKDNIRDMGKQISKVTHNNPLVVFTSILNQIESYDNLILMMVEMFKFMGSLSLDVMGYCLLVRLGGGEKETVKNKLKGMFAINSMPLFISVVLVLMECLHCFYCR